MATACSSAGCQAYSQAFTLGARNSLFVKKQRYNIMVYGQYDNLPSTEYYTIPNSPQTPSDLPNLTLARNSTTGGDPVTLDATFALLTPPETHSFG